MSAKSIDTNVVLYLAGSDLRKRNIAKELFVPGTLLSVQVLNEIASVFTRKWRRSWDETQEFLDLVRALADIRPLDEATHDMGVAIARRHQLSFYDGLMAASALLAGCDMLYSEDMHSGLLISGRLRVTNPFA